MSKLRIVGPDEQISGKEATKVMLELCQKYNNLIELLMMELEEHIHKNTQTQDGKKVVSAPKLVMEMRRLSFELQKHLALDKELNADRKDH